ncbi:hypothetical protein ABIB38_001463 [Massilia sp. UYP11]|uniref:hypothetical protein n=1 Tax=Massilia sp. UYP11 TaxID=1756385 RepID=UPI003D22AE1E
MSANQEAPGQDARATRWLAAWAVFILLLYAAGTLGGASLLRGYRADTEQARQAGLADLHAPPAHAEAARGAAAPPDRGAAAVEVEVGIGVRRVGAVTPHEAGWTGEFTLWFRTPAGAAIDPGKGFRIVNGDVLAREQTADDIRAGRRYQEYRVAARMSKMFDGARFPLGDEALLVEIEDVAHASATLRYVADARDSHVAPDAMPPNVRLVTAMPMVRQQIHRSDGERVARSRFVYAMLAAPNGYGVYLKLFQALFASVAIALLALYIRPSEVDARFGLPVGAFFASVSNVAAIMPLLPPTNRIALSDMINLAGMATIFLVLAQSVIALWLVDTLGRERLAHRFDRLSLAVLLPGYATLNLVLPLAASP